MSALRFAPVSPKFPHLLHGGDYNPEQWLQPQKRHLDDVSAREKEAIAKKNREIDEQVAFPKGELAALRKPYEKKLLHARLELDQRHVGGVDVVVVVVEHLERSIGDPTRLARAIWGRPVDRPGRGDDEGGDCRRHGEGIPV